MLAFSSGRRLSGLGLEAVTPSLHRSRVDQKFEIRFLWENGTDTLITKGIYHLAMSVLLFREIPDWQVRRIGGGFWRSESGKTWRKVCWEKVAKSRIIVLKGCLSRTEKRRDPPGAIWHDGWRGDWNCNLIAPHLLRSSTAFQATTPQFIHSDPDRSLEYIIDFNSFT